MDFPVELFINALIAGLLLGGFYAAVTVGISISFGILDIVNIAHPAFIILGSYIAYIVNQTFGFDPILTSIIVLPAFFALGAAIYQVYYSSFEKYGQDALRGLSGMNTAELLAARYERLMGYGRFKEQAPR